eukprot:Platyproteum_vivax@DN141_c0_g1_i1.p1
MHRRALNEALVVGLCSKLGQASTYHLAPLFVRGLTTQSSEPLNQVVEMSISELQICKKDLDTIWLRNFKEKRMPAIYNKLKMDPSDIKEVTLESQFDHNKQVMRTLEEATQIATQTAAEYHEALSLKADLISLRNQSNKECHREGVTMAMGAFCGAFAAALHPAFLLGTLTCCIWMNFQRGAEKRRLEGSERLPSLKRSVLVLKHDYILALSHMEETLKAFDEEPPAISS